MNLLKKGLLNFGLQKKRINSDDLIYKYKTEGRSLKDLKNYQHVVELFTDLRDGNINQKEVLKDQFNNKSNLGEIKKRKSKTKIIRLNKCYKKC